MDPVKLARAVGLARIGFGAVLLAQPERLGSPWIGPEAAEPGAQVAMRGLGARDLVLGAGTFAATGPDRQRWLAAGIAGDLADLTATLAAGSRIPLQGRLLVAVVATAGMAMGAAALAGLRPQ